MREGSKVVCIDDTFPTQVLNFYTDLPKKGKIYTIRTIEVGIGLNGQEGEIAVTLKEIVNPASKMPPHRERGFLQERFAELEPDKEAENIKEEELVA